MTTEKKTAFGTGSSVVVERCQVCDSDKLESLLFLGYLPPVNTMPLIGARPKEQSGYPADMLYCHDCTLVQLGLVVDPNILFPPEYPYTSSTTKILRDNFAELYVEATGLIDLKPEDLVVDIGSNDGNLLSNFVKGHQVQGITPEEMGRVAEKRGIATMIAFFSREVAKKVRAERKAAKIITATNVFAHIEDPHPIVEGILDLLDDNGVFISESHYLLPLVETLQYDTIYHEHLRYYSLSSISHLLGMHGLEVFHAKRIPTHGGSVRVYAARKGQYEVKPTVAALLAEEKPVVTYGPTLKAFKTRTVLSKLELNKMLLDIKKKGERIFGISAPSRASTLITYVGIDDGTMDAVMEITGSHKIGKCVPGTLIPVLEEGKLFEAQPEYALLLSWHIADELMPKLKAKGFKGDFIIPLPTPRILKNADVAA